MHDKATGNVQRHARYIVGLGQIDDCLTDIVRRLWPTEWNPIGSVGLKGRFGVAVLHIDPLLNQHIDPHGRRQDAGTDGIDGNVVWRHLVGEGLGKTDHSKL